MPSNELLIKINADAKNAVAAFDNVKKQTADLQSVLNKASTVGAVAFAAITAEVGFAVRQFGEAEAASNQLSQALQNQGIFTNQLKQNYVDIAQAISAKTGIDDDQIVQAQAIAQSYLGQIQITKELAAVIVDFGTKVGGTAEAAALIGKAISSSVNPLARYNVEFREGATEAEKYRTVLEKLGVQVGGNAEAANKGVGSLKNLTVAFNDVQKAIGAQLAPLVESISASLTSLFRAIADSPALTSFAAGLLVVGAAITGIIAIVAPLAAIFTTLSAAAIAVGTTLGALALPVLGVVAAIGALVTAGILLRNNWGSLMVYLRSALAGFTTFAVEAFGGLGNLITGVFARSQAQVDAAVNRINGAAAKASAASAAAAKEGFAKIEAEAKASTERQNAAKAAAANVDAAERKQREAAALASRRATDALALAQLKGAESSEITIRQQILAVTKEIEKEKTKAFVDQNPAILAASQARLDQLKILLRSQAAAQTEHQVKILSIVKDANPEYLALVEERLSLEKNLITEQNDAVKVLTKARIDELRELEAAQQAEDIARAKAFEIEKQQAIQDAKADGVQDNPLLNQQLDQVRKEKQTELEVQNTYEKQKLQAKVKADNDYILNQKKFGVVIAAIDDALNSQRFAGAQTLVSSLVNLQNSGNATLRTIGKAAAATQIGIDTAKGAVAAYTGAIEAFGPIFGQPIGIAAAAAVIAYGAEQEANLFAANSGGVVPGGGPNQDSVHAFLTPGELVAPRQSFNEVVSGVQTERSGIIDKISEKLDSLGSGATGLTVVVNGDFVGDEAYARRLGKVISDQIQYKNLRFAGARA